MGEDKIISGGLLLFCKAEDLETGEERWNQLELKSIDLTSARHSTSVPKMNDSKLWGSCSFSLSAEVNDNGSIREFMKNSWKKEKGRRHYMEKSIKHMSRKDIRRWVYLYKKWAAFSNQQ